MKEYIIDVNLNSIEDIYHPYSNTTLNPELSKYLLEECRGIPASKNIVIKFICDYSLTKKEQDSIIELVHNNFRQELKEELMLSHIFSLFHIVIFLLGLIALFLSYFDISSILKEIFLIIGWLAIWEVVYNLIFVYGSDSIKRKRYYKFSKAKIVFD